LFEHAILIDILPPQYWVRRHDEYSSREASE
jgi:hypothetical protein